MRDKYQDRWTGTRCRRVQLLDPSDGWIWHRRVSRRDLGTPLTGYWTSIFGQPDILLGGVDWRLRNEESGGI